MVQVGLLLSDVPTSVSPSQQFRDVLRIVEAAQANDFTYIAIGQHFLYGDLRWLQPVPLLARLAAEVGPDVRLVTQIMIAPLYHPVLLA
jgi:alkanesulfonate monooxygenase SsuD/methylene tetrahydromethanopterin reductase-like flavin-dependent oxidoreductase (luciferase family)